jgi:phage baseplate assembly protein gpV
MIHPQQNDFAGKNGFIWWTGVIVDRKDPANLGRCKVRIIGWHDENKNLSPVEDLPWAQILTPPNHSKNFALPKEGEWVMGYFLDGNNAQLPVIMGVYPGLVAKDPTKATPLAWHDERKQSEIDQDPKPPSEVIVYTVGEPTVSRQGRGVVEGTMIAKNNKDLAHVCDFISEMQKNINLKKYTKALANKLREMIRAVMRALGFTDATGQYSWILNKLKAYAREVRRIQKEIIQPIIDFEKYVLAYITKIRAMIQWLLSLPERFLQMLHECLQKFLKLVAQIFYDTIMGFKEGIKMDEFDEVIAAAKDAVNATYDLANKTLVAAAGAQAIVTSATQGLLIPTSDAEVEAANTYINSYTSNSDNAVKKVNAGLQAP